MIKYIQSQIQEISFYKSLRWYGFFLSLVHVVTFFFWHHNSFINQYLTKNANTLCWPQVPFCEFLRFLSPSGVQALLYIYLSMALLAAFFFLNKKTIVYAYWLFLFVNVIKFYMFFSDYHVMGNHHYMPFVVSFVYLFIRQKLFFIPLVIACFYFFAAILKVSNLDWLTGMAFVQNVQFPLFFNEEIKMILCFYVVCLEMIGSWLLILKTRWKMAVYIQFILFHLMSYFIVGYFYPVIMLLLISLFLLIVLFNERYVTVWSFRKIFPGALFIFLVIAGNLLSVFIPGDAGLTGEGRLWGVNMYDAHTECDSQIFLKFKKNNTLFLSGYESYTLRVKCDPYIGFNTVKKVCAFYKNKPEFIDLDWSVYSKLRSDLEYKRIVDEKNACGKNLQYFSWRKNHWIKVKK